MRILRSFVVAAMKLVQVLPHPVLQVKCAVSQSNWQDGVNKGRVETSPVLIVPTIFGESVFAEILLYLKL
jgi:hypothetical protein